MSIGKTVEFGSQELDLRLEVQDMVSLENKLKNKSLMTLFMGLTNEVMLKLAELLLIIHAANKTGNVKEADMMNLYGQWMQQGNGYMELVQLVEEVLEASGFFGKKVTEEAQATDLALTETLNDEENTELDD